MLQVSRCLLEISEVKWKWSHARQPVWLETFKVAHPGVLYRGHGKSRSERREQNLVGTGKFPCYYSDIEGALGS